MSQARLSRGPGLRRDRRGTIAILVGFLIPVLLLVAGLVVDATVWTLGSTRLQLAADSAASSAILTLQTPAFQKESSAQQQADLQAIVNYEVAASASKLAGAISTAPSVTFDTSTFASVTVALSSQAPSFFGGIVSVAAPTLSATATASMTTPTGVQAQVPCLLLLAAIGADISIDNSGSIVASSCAVFSDSLSVGSISVNTGVLSAASIGAGGSLSLSNSGGNVINQVVQAFQTPIPDPYAGTPAPASGACNAPVNNFTAYGTYALKPSVFCGDVTIGGNGSTVSFAPGIYTIVNGNLTFNNANITSASGVTFVLTGLNPGSVSYTNDTTNAVMSAPTTGATAGVLIWQVCNALNPQQDSFQGNSTLQATGLIYAPCARFDIGNKAQLTGALNGSFSLIGASVYVHGSASLHTNTAVTTTAAKPALTN